VECLAAVVVALGWTAPILHSMGWTAPILHSIGWTAASLHSMGWTPWAGQPQLFTCTMGWTASGFPYCPKVSRTGALLH